MWMNKVKRNVKLSVCYVYTVESVEPCHFIRKMRSLTGGTVYPGQPITSHQQRWPHQQTTFVRLLSNSQSYDLPFFGNGSPLFSPLYNSCLLTRLFPLTVSFPLPTALHSTASPVPFEIWIIVDRWAASSLMEMRRASDAVAILSFEKL